MEKFNFYKFKKIHETLADLNEQYDKVTDKQFKKYEFSKDEEDIKEVITESKRFKKFHGLSSVVFGALFGGCMFAVAKISPDSQLMKHLLAFAKSGAMTFGAIGAYHIGSYVHHALKEHRYKKDLQDPTEMKEVANERDTLYSDIKQVEKRIEQYLEIYENQIESLPKSLRKYAYAQLAYLDNYTTDDENFEYKDYFKEPEPLHY